MFDFDGFGAGAPDILGTIGTVIKAAADMKKVMNNDYDEDKPVRYETPAPVIVQQPAPVPQAESKQQPIVINLTVNVYKDGKKKESFESNSNKLNENDISI